MMSLPCFTRRTVVGLLACLFLSFHLLAREPAMTNIPLPADLVAADAKVQVASGVCFLEGPAVDAEGNVYFSDIAGNRILKRDAKGLINIFRADSGRTNGNT